MLANVGSAYLVSGEDPIRYGNAHASVVPYQIFPTKDSEIVLAVGNDRQFNILCDQVLERPEIAANARFATNRARLENRQALIQVLGEVLRTRNAAYWLERLSSTGIPTGCVRSVRAALESAEAVARDMVVTVQHPKAGALRLVASPLRLSGTPVRTPVAPPMLGEHTDEVLRELLGEELA